MNLKKLQDKIEKLEHMMQVFLSVKVTFLVTEYNFT